MGGVLKPANRAVVLRIVKFVRAFQVHFQPLYLLRNFVAVMAGSFMGITHAESNLENAKARIGARTGQVTFKTNILHNKYQRLEGCRGVEPLSGTAPQFCRTAFAIPRGEDSLNFHEQHGLVGRQGIEPLAGPPQSSDGIGFTARHGEDDPLGCMFQIVLRLRIKEL